MKKTYIFSRHGSNLSVHQGMLYNGILFSHKKEGNFDIVTIGLDLEGVMPSNTSQTEKDKYHMISLICGI